MRSQAVLPMIPSPGNLRQRHRYHYSPQADRLPRWLRHVWAWF